MNSITNKHITFYTMPGRTQPIRSRESRCIFCGTLRVVVEYIIFHESFPAFITASKLFPPNAWQRAAPSFIKLSLDFANAKPNNSFEFGIVKSNSLEKPDTRGGILYADVEEFIWETLTEIQERWRRVSIRKTLVTFAQNKCSEAKIVNDLQPKQSQDKSLHVILDSVGS